jgi:hypothetical protein
MRGWKTLITDTTSDPENESHILKDVLDAGA